MTVTASGLLLYTGALFILFITPGPVWVALLARSLSGGFAAAWPLAVGVALGDILWPLAAILGVAWLVSAYAGIMLVMKWIAVAVFIVMGIGLIRSGGHSLRADSRLTRPGRWAGFVAGVAVILGNPKAVLFYIGVLPGFFDLTQVTVLDIIAICALSVAVPLIGNLVLAGFIGRMRGVLKSPETLRRINIVAGFLLVAVGGVIALS